MKATGDIPIGTQFNSWTIQRHIDGMIYECKCKCGHIGRVRIHDLAKNKSRMCRKCSASLFTSRTHGMSKTKLYRTWKDMKYRCCKKGNTGYENYGGRGIIVCDEWTEDFMNFYKWSKDNGYSEELEIDRIDVNGDYKPSNCRWVTKTTQNNNTRRNHYIYYKGKKYTLSQLSRKHGLKPLVVYKRLKRGWTVEEAVTIKLNGRRKDNEKHRSCA